MANISQTIPSYIFGISEQPDMRKKPGQVTAMDNALPDITSGLVKRPGTRMVQATLTNEPGKWFNIYRDENEQYIGHVARDDGDIRIWNALTGAPVTVNRLAPSSAPVFPNPEPRGNQVAPFNAQAETYLEHNADEDLQAITINDFTFITNRLHRPRMTAQVTPGRPNEAVYEVKVLAYGREYRFETFAINTDGSKGSSLGAATTTTAGATGTDTDVVSANTILTALRTSLIGSTNWSASDVEIIGNTLYLSNSTPFTIETSDTQLGNAFTSEVNNIERLPYQGKAGYEVKVVNSDNEDDDFYVKFIGTAGNPDNAVLNTANPAQWVEQTAGEGLFGADGEGYWTEWIAQGVHTSFNNTDMPIQLVRQSNGTFLASLINYEPRKVGDDGTNPLPAFIDEDNPDGTSTVVINGSNVITGNGQAINKVLLFRNRLVFLNSGNVTTSQAGSFFDWFSTSSLALAPTDPIDVSASSQQPAILYDGIEINNGFLLFSKFQQYLLTSADAATTNETIKLQAISYYEFDTTTSPVPLGTTFGFCNSAGNNFRFFEMLNINDETEPTVVEQSKVVSRFLPQRVDKIADSKESTILLFSTTSTITVNGQQISRGREVWGYRYFDNATDRLQSAWFRWIMPGTVVFHCIMRDVYYVVLNVNGQNQLHEADIKSTTDTNFIWDLPEAVYRIHLDSNSEIASGGITYTAATDKSTFTLPTGLFNLADTVVTNQKIVNGRPEPALQNVTKVATVTLLNSAHSGATNGDVYEVINTTGLNSASPSVANLPAPTTLWSNQISAQVERTTAGWDYQNHFPIAAQNYRPIACYTIADGPNQGRLAMPDINGTTVTLDGNWKNTRILNITNNTTTAADGLYKDLRMDEVGGGNNGRNMRASLRVADGRIVSAYLTNDGDNWNNNDVVRVDPNNNGYDINNPNPFPNARFQLKITNTNLEIGYLFKMSLQLPKFYRTKESGPSRTTSYTRGSLIIHRCNFEIGPTGNFDVILHRKGREDYTYNISGPYFDYYKANEPSLTPEVSATTACYERNTNMNIELHSEHPSPFTLYTMSWEGDYSDKYYREI